MIIIEINIFIEENGETKPFYLSIEEPRRSVGSDDYYCRIISPVLFNSEKDIFGVDENQAIDLAKNFANSALKGKKFFDSNGNAVAIFI